MNRIVITSVSEFENAINQLILDESQPLFRGQAEDVWPVSCSAARRLTVNHASQIEKPLMRFPLVGYMNFLTSKAKMRRLLPPEYNATSHELEVLAQLQHYGAATGLIDFTRQPAVALWFACNKSPSANGAVYVLASSRTVELNKVDFSEIIESLYQDEVLWLWEPTSDGNRISAQDSVFVLGGPEIEPDQMTKFTIRADCKSEILSQLTARFNINEELLNPDFPGYAVANGVEQPLEVNHTVHYWRNQITESLPRSKKITAHNNCGMAFRAVRDFENAVIQFGETICLDPEHPEAYINRGHSYASLNRHRDAIYDFNKAFCFNPNCAEIYYLRGISYSSIDQHEDAIIDFNFTLVFDPDHPTANNRLHRAISDTGQLSANRTVLIFNNPNGDRHLENWLSEITDSTAIANVYASIDQLRSGNHRNSLHLHTNLHELRTFPSSQYRIYFCVQEETTLVVNGGSSENQRENIQNAYFYLGLSQGVANANIDTTQYASSNYNDWIIKQLGSPEEIHSYLQASVLLFERDHDAEALVYSLRSIASALNQFQPTIQSNINLDSLTETILTILDSVPNSWPKVVVPKLLELINQLLLSPPTLDGTQT